jgi:hypothetical protein
MGHRRVLLAPEPDLDIICAWFPHFTSFPHLEDDSLDVTQPAENGVPVSGHRRVPIQCAQGVEDSVAALLVTQLVDPGEVFRVIVYRCRAGWATRSRLLFSTNIAICSGTCREPVARTDRTLRCRSNAVSGPKLVVDDALWCRRQRASRLPVGSVHDVRTLRSKWRPPSRP